jgi:hypothetical protein
MMRATAEVKNPGAIEFSITLTATLSEWKELRALLGAEKWPAWKVSEAIGDVVRQAEGRFYHIAKEENDQ